MPTPKSKDGSATLRHYDDATLAQKREYWRTKKREQRARLSECRGTPTQVSPAKKLLRNPTLVDSTLSASSPTSLSPVLSHDKSHTTAAVSPASKTVKNTLLEATENQKPKWIHTMKPCIVVPPSPPSCSHSHAAGGSLNRAGTSPSLSQLNSTSSVPPVRVTMFTNSSSAQTSPQPHVSMQATPVHKHQQVVASCVQPKLSPNNVLTSKTHGFSPHDSISIKAEGKEENTEPQSGTKSALAAKQNAGGVGTLRRNAESEEERAARRREHWRMKKREQRAKQGSKMAAQKTELAGPKALPSQPLLKGAGQKPCPTLVKVTFTSARKENNKLQAGGGGAGLATMNMQVKVQDGTTKMQRVNTSDDPCGKRWGEPLRKLPGYTAFSSVSRGMVRCRTPRQRFIEAQKSFLNQRNVRCKTPLLLSVISHSRNIPRLDPNDTPEQIIAKRREYWRVKKREQRAKLSLEVKARLKEKDSVMRRMKRYQAILEEMRRARAQSMLTHASETIGGFIKEDGTVTIKVPQGPKGPNRAAGDVHVQSSSISPVSQPQHQLRTKPSGLLCPAQVKVSIPFSGLSHHRLPKVPPVRTKTQRESTTLPHRLSSPSRTVGQLFLTQPPQSATSSGGPSPGGCIMKMAVSSGPALLTLSLDPGLTEEERMAKKREYWRVKKREQRAARAARLKQGVLHARANAVLQRRWTMKQVNPGHQSRRVANLTRNTHAPSDNSVPLTPNANEIKQEAEAVPSVDLHSHPDPAICPDIKGPTSPPPPQPESDPVLCADSQATTLLAVASMKKLLEESLSTVRECKGHEPPDAPEEDAAERETKPDVPQLFFEEDEVAPLAANLTLQIKSWQSDSEDLVPSRSPSPRLASSPQRNVPTSSDGVPTCEHASQTNPTFTVIPSMDASTGPLSPQSFCAKKEEPCSSPEPPKLHHLPIDHLHSPCQVQQKPQQQHQGRKSPSAQRCHTGGAAQDGLSSLQRKREYWKLMKRQQRAKLKAGQRESPGGRSSRLLPTSIQARGLVTINSVRGVNHQANPTLRSKQLTASLTAASRTPPVSVLGPTSRAEPRLHTLRVKAPVTPISSSPGCEQGHLEVKASHIMSPCEYQHGAITRSQRWMSRSAEVDSAQALPTLKPPENPLSSINLQPIEPHVQSPDPPLSPIRIPPQRQDASPTMHSPLKVVSLSNMAPPKPIPGESQEDFLKRKREYWRVKKKEQRARKAIQDKGTASKTAASSWRPIMPAPDTPAQDSGQWISSSEESDHVMSKSADTEQGAYHYSNYTASVEDDPELLFPDYENHGGEEASLSNSVWRNSYLMDYDPLNQLLVCMVCGELQYSHSREGVQAHIDDAHPDTLTLEAGERRRILEAWDEQVSRRERFFTSQLQQHSGT